MPPTGPLMDSNESAAFVATRQQQRFHSSPSSACPALTYPSGVKGSVQTRRYERERAKRGGRGGTRAGEAACLHTSNRQTQNVLRAGGTARPGNADGSFRARAACNTPLARQHPYLLHHRVALAPHSQATARSLRQRARTRQGARGELTGGGQRPTGPMGPRGDRFTSSSFVPMSFFSAVTCRHTAAVNRRRDPRWLNAEHAQASTRGAAHGRRRPIIDGQCGGTRQRTPVSRGARRASSRPRRSGARGH